MNINPDDNIIWQLGIVKLNATLAFTLVVTAILLLFSWLATRRLRSKGAPGTLQGLLEVIVEGISSQVREISGQDPSRYIPFVGTLFLFIAISNLLSVVPYFDPPTRSISTTAALALCVFFAVPIYGVTKRGVRAYFADYLKPSPFMLPFNIMGELSRTLALAVRLFGNMLSGTMIVGILLSIIPIIFPVVMNLMGLLTGLIQAYIFSVLAMVYIASATRVQEARAEKVKKQEDR